MRVIFAVLAIAALASALPEIDETMLREAQNSFDEPSDDLELVETHAKAAVFALKKKGTSEADCKKLAETSCKTVEAEIRNDQTQMKQLKSGNQCLNLGQDQVMKATAEFHRTMKEHKKAMTTVTLSHNVNVKFGEFHFNDIRKAEIAGHCNMFFTHRHHVAAKSTYEKNVRIELTWKGRVREALRAKLLAEAEARRLKKRCLCTTKKTRDEYWKVIMAPKRQTTLKKAHAKCKMMQCVLNGTPISDKRCKSTLQKVAKKTLHKEAEAVHSCGTLPSVHISKSKLD